MSNSPSIVFIGRVCTEIFTITKHLVVCQLSVFGVQHAKFKVDRALENHNMSFKQWTM